jgi:hypothetical protein
MSRRNRSKSRGRNATLNKSMTKSMKGGDGSDYVLRTYGNGQQQFDNTFANGGMPGNVIKPLGMSGGRKRSRSRSRRSKKGGFFGLEPIISQALVPFSLFGLQKYLK